MGALLPVWIKNLDLENIFQGFISLAVSLIGGLLQEKI